MCIKVTIINFTVTMRGLEDQLLVDTIKCERPDLEEKRDALVVSIANDQKQLLDIEEQILRYVRVCDRLFMNAYGYGFSDLPL